MYLHNVYIIYLHMYVVCVQLVLIVVTVSINNCMILHFDYFKCEWGKQVSYVTIRSFVFVVVIVLEVYF